MPCQQSCEDLTDCCQHTVASILSSFTPLSSYNSAINKDAVMAFDAISCIMSQLVVNTIKLATKETISVLCRKEHRREEGQLVD